VSGGAQRVAEGDERLDIAATAHHGHCDPHGALAFARSAT